MQEDGEEVEETLRNQFGELYDHEAEPFNIVNFLNNSSAELADKAIDIIIEYDLFDMHLTSMAKGEVTGSPKHYRAKIALLESIYHRCSMKMATIFIKYQYEGIVESNNDEAMFDALSELIYLFKDTAN